MIHYPIINYGQIISLSINLPGHNNCMAFERPILSSSRKNHGLFAKVFLPQIIEDEKTSRYQTERNYLSKKGGKSPDQLK